MSCSQTTISLGRVKSFSAPSSEAEVRKQFTFWLVWAGKGVNNNMNDVSMTLRSPSALKYINDKKKVKSLLHPPSVGNNRVHRSQHLVRSVLVQSGYSLLSELHKMTQKLLDSTNTQLLTAAEFPVTRKCVLSILRSMSTELHFECGKWSLVFKEEQNKVQRGNEAAGRT